MVDDNGYIKSPIVDKIALVDEWEEGIYMMLEGDPLEKTEKTEKFLRRFAYDFFDAREKHRKEMEKIKAMYKEMRENNK